MTKRFVDGMETTIGATEKVCLAACFVFCFRLGCHNLECRYYKEKVFHFFPLVEWQCEYFIQLFISFIEDHQPFNARIPFFLSFKSFGIVWLIISSGSTKSLPTMKRAVIGNNFWLARYIEFPFGMPRAMPESKCSKQPSALATMCLFHCSAMPQRRVSSTIETTAMCVLIIN